MPATTITVTSDQREGLYELVRNHLGSVGDLFDALERDKDFVEAERLGIEFAEDFRLLQDLGWGERDTRESVELTMPPHDLMEVLNRLHGEAEVVLAGANPSPEDAETNQRFLRGLDACETVLVNLDSSGSQRA
ncbi:MAG TPA: hypothetical protein VG816_07695 [Solirubrobacterales bacterium]|nr:hypothetical protein [Solirubrobacterales bacterium]